jgi:hypothetical protein
MLIGYNWQNKSLKPSPARRRAGLGTRWKMIMNNHIAIAAVLMISAFSAIGQPPDILADLLKPPPIDPAITNIPPLSPIKPTPETFPTLPQSPTFTDPEIITKSNQRLFSADFEIEIRDSSPFVTNVTVSAKLERKYKLTDLQTVHLLVGSTLGDNELITMGQAKLFVPLWHQARFKQETPSDSPIFINFVLTRELTREAYLRLECF